MKSATAAAAPSWPGADANSLDNYTKHFFTMYIMGALTHYVITMLSLTFYAN